MRRGGPAGRAFGNLGTSPRLLVPLVPVEVAFKSGCSALWCYGLSRLDLNLAAFAPQAMVRLLLHNNLWGQCLDNARFG